MRFAFPPRRILVPVDMSQPSLAALAAAKIMVRDYGGRLELVYIQDIPLSLLGFEGEIEAGAARGISHQMQDFARWRADRLRELSKDMKPGSATQRSVRGWPPQAIADLAKGRHADLVVMGTHGYGGFDHLVFGSVTEAVVRKSEIPVLSVHRGRPLRVRRVLAPFNLEVYAEGAVRYAAELARAAGARLGVLYAAPEGAWDEDSRSELKSRLKALLGKETSASARLVVRRGPAAHAIMEEAGGYDLVVLAAHRRHFWSGLVLGSTAERVLRHCPVPVLSVPSSEKAASRARGPLTAPVWTTDRIF